MIDYIIDIDKNLFIYLHNLGSETWDFLWLFFSNKIVMFSFMTFTIFIHSYRFKREKWGTLVLFFIICISLTDFLHVQLFLHQRNYPKIFSDFCFLMSCFLKI